MTSLETGRAGLPALDLAEVADRATILADGARAQATRRAYQSDWRHFEAWCRGHARSAMPATPETVGLYITAHEAALSVATLTRRLSTIATAQRMAGHHLDTRHPAIRDVLRGLKRAHGIAQRHAAALTTPLLRRVLDTCGTGGLIDRRDRALLLLGFGGALRRSELVGLDVDDVAIVDEGLRITIRRSKGDQEGEGQLVGIGRTGTATCPVAGYEAWITAAAIISGRVFRSVDRHGRVGEGLSTRAVAQIVQQRAAKAGLDAQR